MATRTAARAIEKEIHDSGTASLVAWRMTDGRYRMDICYVAGDGFTWKKDRVMAISESRDEAIEEAYFKWKLAKLELALQ